MAFLLNAIFCALNAWAYLALGHNPINLAVAIFCGMVAIACAIREY